MKPLQQSSTTLDASRMPWLGYSGRALAWFVLLLAVEVYIALAVRDDFVRPYGGDFLAVIWVHAGLRVLLARASARCLALGAFMLGAGVELLQWFGVSTRLGFDQFVALRILLGSAAEWSDILAYALGALVVWVVDERTALLRRRSVPFAQRQGFSADGARN